MKKNILKKSLIALSMSASIVFMPLAAEMPNLDHIDGVPANTVVFSGYLKPFPLKLYYQNINTNMYGISNVEDFKEKLNRDKTPTGKFFASLLVNFLDSVDNFESLAKNYGLADEIRALIYGVDLVPVFKYETENPNAIWDILATAEKDSGLKGVKQNLGGVEYTSYLLTTGKENGEIELVVATNDKWVTITAKYVGGDNEHLKVALGVEKPTNPLNKTNILQDINEKYGFDGSNVTYIDHRKIVDVITGKTSNRFISERQKNNALKTADCQAEFANIANMWPRTVMGTNALEISEQKYSEKMRLIVEINDEQTNKALMQLRGHIPSYINGAKGQMLSVALGVDVGAIAPVLTKLWQSATRVEYKCAPLVEMQKELKSANPAMVGMFAGMARGVKGLSYTLFNADIDFSGDEPKVNNANQILSLAAEKPYTQFLSLSMLHPGFSKIKLPQDGGEVALNTYFPELDDFGGLTKMAAIGKYLNIYQGDIGKNTSDEMAKNDIETNGFLEIYMDYSPVFKLINKAIIASGEELPAGYKEFEDVDMQFDFKMDFTQNGIEFLSEANIQK